MIRIFPFDLQLFAGEDELLKLSVEELVAVVKSERKEQGGLRSRITVLEGDKKMLVDERDALKTERDTLKTAEAEREEQRLKDEKKWEELATKEREKREKAENDAKERVTAAERKAADELATRDKQIVRSEARAAAVKAGIIDEDDVDLLGLDALKLEDGKVVGIDEWLTKAKETKPHKFKVEGGPQPTPRPQPTPPGPKPLGNTDPKTVGDWRTMSDDDFAKREAELFASNPALRSMRV